MGADPAEVALAQRAAHGRINTDDVKALFAAGHHDLITAVSAPTTASTSPPPPKEKPQ